MEMQLAPVVESRETLPPPPAEIVIASPAPKRRGRPAKVAPPSDSLFKALLKEGRAALAVTRDDATGLDVTVATIGGDMLRLRYDGPSDRSLPQLVKHAMREEPTLDVTPTDCAMPYGHRVSIAASIATEALDFVALAMSRDVTRYNLCGVLLDKGGRWVATDGHRMHIYGEGEMASPAPRDVILPRHAVVTLQRALKATKATALEIGWREDMPAYLYFRCVGAFASVEMRCRLVDGQFPAWQNVVPSVDGCDAILHVDEIKSLRAALETAPIKIQHAGHHQRTLSVSREVGAYGVRCVSHDRKDSVPLPVRLVGIASDFTFTLNASYLDDALSEMVCDVRIRTNCDGMAPILFENGPRMALVMPMRA